MGNVRKRLVKLFCEVLYRNIEDYKRLGYDTKTLERIYEVKCR